LGIAQRRIHIKIGQKQYVTNRPNLLPNNIKTLGDRIRSKRLGKNLTSGKRPPKWVLHSQWFGHGKLVNGGQTVSSLEF
jgi:hypothetical protein